jgi:hypothetical protein
MRTVKASDGSTAEHDIGLQQQQQTPETSTPTTAMLLLFTAGNCCLSARSSAISCNQQLK